MKLIVPESDNSTHPDTIVTPVMLREWIELLPKADQKGMLAAICEALAHLNRSPDEIPQRLALIRIYQELFDNTYQSTAPKPRSLPSSKGTQAGLSRLDLLLRLNQELGFSYHRVLNEQADSLDPETLRSTILQAMTSLERTILHACADYRQIRQTTRMELLTLFLLAEAKGIEQAAGSDGEDSPELIFKRVQLLLLTDPYSLPTQSIWLLNDYLRRYGHLVALGQQFSSSTFLIDTQGSSPCRIVDEEPPVETEDGRYRYLDTRQLCETTLHLTNAASNNPPQLPEGLERLKPIEVLQLLTRWVRNWCTPQNRQSERRENRKRIMIACGLNTIHHYLLHGSLQPEPVYEEGWEEIVMEGDEFYSYSPEADGHPIYEWDLLDLSPSGAGLVELENNGDCFQVGQLILMAPESTLNNRNAWMIGVIRRKLEGELSQGRIGIQFINGRLYPLEIKPLVTGPGDALDFTPTFMINREDAPSLLLASPGIYRPERGFFIRSNGHTRRIKSVNLSESTRYFDLFTFHMT